MFLEDMNFAEFKTKSNKKRKRKEEPPVVIKDHGVKKDWNNWEKAREARNQVSAMQRLSADARGWLSFANRLGR